MSRKLALAALALAFSTWGPLGCSRAKPASLTFLDESQPVSSLSVEQLTHAIEPVRVDVIEPYEDARVTFSALPLEQVLDEAYGPSWRTREAILFTCRDGYEPTIPIRRVLEHRPFLAIERLGDVGFTILKDEGGSRKRVDLGPFYVIWENLDDVRVRTEGDYGWPYQVTKIELVSFQSRFREMAPPPDADAEVVAGFAAFVAHCSKCHAINGRGGVIGPELNYPVNPTEYLKDGWLRKWIDDPTSMRFAPRMPPLNPDLPDRSRVIDEIVAYLTAMTSYKVEPRKP